MDTGSLYLHPDDWKSVITVINVNSRTVSEAKQFYFWIPHNYTVVQDNTDSAPGAFGDGHNLDIEIMIYISAGGSSFICIFAMAAACLVKKRSILKLSQKYTSMTSKKIDFEGKTFKSGGTEAELSERALKI